MSLRRALITGITAQDGSYLAEAALEGARPGERHVACYPARRPEAVVERV